MHVRDGAVRGHLRLVVVVAWAACVLLSACAGSSGPRTYGAAIPSSDAFVGIVRSGTQALAYVCDGAKDGVSMALWFRGPVSGNALDATEAGGAHLQVRFSGDTSTGSITLANGKTRTFTATSLTGSSGLYRAEGTFTGVPYVAGWVVLPNGEQRGGVSGGGTMVAAPLLNTQTRVAQVEGLGTLAAAKAVPPLQATISRPPVEQTGIGGGIGGFGGASKPCQAAGFGSC